jgi:ABC-type glutathione transport system ATPase component
MAREPAQSLLDVDGLRVRYPVSRGLLGALARRPQVDVRAVDGVSLAVRAGELFALVGESGCGKTTTAQAVLRLVDADAGTIAFDGRDITRLGARELRPLRRRMQIVYQDPYESLDPRLRVRAAVEEPLVIHGLGGRRTNEPSSSAARSRESSSHPSSSSSTGTRTSCRAGSGSVLRSRRRSCWSPSSWWRTSPSRCSTCRSARGSSSCSTTCGAAASGS